VQTELLRVNPVHPEAEAIARAAEVLRSGRLVAFPTETVYGLGANALDAAAVARIFAAKERPAANPVIVHVPDAAAVRSLVTAWPESAERLAARFWPGPLTLILPRSTAIPDIVTAGGPTVAIRVPAHPVARALLEQAGVPIAAPSANRASRLSPTLAAHVLGDLDGRIDLLLDGGPTSGGVESTVLDLSGATPCLLRPGLVSPAQLEAVVGPVTRRATIGSGTDPLPSPGMMARHYAPQTPVECLLPAAVQKRIAELAAQGMRVGWLAFPAEPTPAAAGVRRVTMPNLAAAYAACLYAVLHDLDAAGLERIIVTLPPEGDDWLMIHDRLARASAT
jgi:L-threonylcarbamoyladenylate synthase